eukprot:CAMPEP_0114993162 /NCGR_PEP_ID=MMETSP0216-20121206/12369_1 /TAXON_ID=223996 /ORGANISM="Protocruzia adherens, Strain Boccale" /LENGTH=975 /DNA_ID=CAMNT_0002356759 /DNA_START=59 /DNA_END=2983 /DNA_ORIENTATION=-
MTVHSSFLEEKINQIPQITPLFKYSSPDFEVIRVLPTRSLLVTALTGGGVAVYNLKTGRNVHQYQGWLSASITAMEPNLTESLLFLGFSNGNIAIFDLDSGEVQSLRSSSETLTAVSCLALSPDGSKLAAATGTQMTIWSLNSWEITHRYHNIWHNFEQAVFSGNSRKLFTVSDMEVGEYHLKKETYTTIYEGFSDCDSIEISESGRFILRHLLYSGTFQVTDVHSTRVLNEFALSEVDDTRAAFTRDGKMILAWNKKGNVQLLRSVSRKDKVWDLGDYPKGSQPLDFFDSSVAIKGVNGEFYVKPIRNREESTKMTISSHGSAPNHVAFTNYGSQVVLGYDSKDFEILDAKSGVLMRQFSFDSDQEVTSFVFSDDCDRVFSIGKFQGIRVNHLNSSAPNYSLVDYQASPFTSLALAPSTRTLFAGSADGSLWSWDLAENRLRSGLPRWGRPEITKILVSPDERILVALSADGTAEVFSGLRFRLIRTIQTKQNHIGHGILTPNNAFLFTADTHSTKMWQLATGKLVRTIPHGPRGISSLSIDSDGVTLIIGTPKSGILLRPVYDDDSIVQLVSSGIVSMAFDPLNDVLIASSPEGVFAVSTPPSSSSSLSSRRERDGPRGRDRDRGRGRDNDRKRKKFYWNPLDQQWTKVCPVGLFADRSRRVCDIFCSRGFYSDSSSRTCVSRCPSGFVKNTASMQCSKECDDGFWEVNGECLAQCPRGQLGDESYNQCHREWCPSGMVKDAMSGMCHKSCPVGTYYHEGTEECVDECPEGTFQYPSGAQCGTECWHKPTAPDGQCTPGCDFMTADKFPGGKSESMLIKFFKFIEGQSYMVATLIFVPGFVVYALIALVVTLIVKPSNFSQPRGKLPKIAVLVLLPVINAITILVYMLEEDFSEPLLKYGGMLTLLGVTLFRMYSDIVTGHALVWNIVLDHIKNRWDKVEKAASVSIPVKVSLTLYTVIAVTTVSFLQAFLSW